LLGDLGPERQRAWGVRAHGARLGPSSPARPGASRPPHTPLDKIAFVTIMGTNLVRLMPRGAGCEAGEPGNMSTSSRFAGGVHILALMAAAEDEPVKSDWMAKSVNTNPVVIRRILCSLSRAELVSSQTGALGGSRLARDPGRISLLDVYRAVEEGCVFGMHRQSPNRRCPVGGHIQTVLQGVLEDANMAVEGVLAKTTIEEVLRSVKGKEKVPKR